MSTREEIKSVIGYLALAFPNFRPVLEGSPNSVDVYADLLGDLEPDLLRLAVREACAELGREFAPSAGEIRSAAMALRARAAGTPSAAEAWGAVMESFRRIRSQAPALLQHPLVQKAIHCMGGLERIGMSEDNMADRAHFLKIYEQLLEREQADAALLPASQEYVRRLPRGPDVGAIHELPQHDPDHLK